MKCYGCRTRQLYSIIVSLIGFYDAHKKDIEGLEMGSYARVSATGCWPSISLYRHSDGVSSHSATFDIMSYLMAARRYMPGVIRM